MNSGAATSTNVGGSTLSFILLQKDLYISREGDFLRCLHQCDLLRVPLSVPGQETSRCPSQISST